MSDARGGQTGLKVLEKLNLSPQFSRKWRSSLFLKILSDVAVTISFGKQFQLSHTLLEKANFPISKLRASRGKQEEYLVHLKRKQKTQCTLDPHHNCMFRDAIDGTTVKRLQGRISYKMLQ